MNHKKNYYVIKGYKLKINKLEKEKQDLQKKLKEIEDYCTTSRGFNLSVMWAAVIYAIINGISFTDSPRHYVNKLLMEEQQ